MARSRIIAGKAVIVIEAQNLVNKTLGKIRSNLHKFANEVGNIGEGLFRTGFFGSIASGAVVHSFIAFDDAMRDLRVNLDLFGKSAQQVDAVMKPLERTIRSLAQTTPFNPTEVAGAAKELAKGGFTPKQITDSLQAVLDLSRATNTELGFSAEFLVRSMTTYGIATDRASEIVSQFVRSARKGTLGIEDLEAAMRYSSGTADTLGVSLQTMLSIFTVLSNRGLVGSIAGTSTNTAFSQLVKKAQQLKDIGKIDLVTGIREDGREAIDVIASLENLFRFAETLPFTEQQTLFQDIFNLRGARSVAGLRKELEKVRDLRNQISNADDEGRESARIRDEGPGGSLRRLLSTLQDLNITLGQSTEKIIISIASTIKGLLEQLEKLAKLNPALTALIILSPGILVAAGVGMLAFSKALRLAAYGASALRATLVPLGRLLAQGTLGQLTLLSSIGTTKKSIKKPSKRTPNFTPIAQTSNVTQLRSARTQLGISKGQVAVQTRLAASLRKRAQAETLLAKIVQRRGVGTGASEFATAAATRARAAQAAKSARLAKGAQAAAQLGIRESVRSIGFTAQRRATTGLVTFTKGMLNFINVARRFAFSFSGVLTVFELLFLFGDKIPGVATVLKRLGTAFSDAFRAIGNIARYAAGPIDLLKASIEAFTAGRADVGIKALTNGFKLLASIIKNQVVLAWARFRQALGSVWGLLRQIGLGVVQVFTSIVTSIGTVITTIVSRISTEMGIISRLFGGEGAGFGFEQGVSVFSDFVKQLTLFASNIPILFASVIEKMGATLDIFILKFELATKYAADLLNPFAADRPDADILQKIINRIDQSNKEQAKLEQQRQENIKKANKLAETISLPNMGRYIAQLQRTSQQLMQQGFNSAAAVRAEINKVIEELKKQAADFGQGIKGTPPGKDPLVQVTKLMADALVGSAQSTRRNLLRQGKQIEEKQLDELKRIRELNEAMARDQGLRFAP